MNEPTVETNETSPPDDPDLMSEDDVDDEMPEDDGPQQQSSSPRKKRKRGKGTRGQFAEDFAQAKSRPFVESQVRSSLAKSDPAEVMNRWDWDSGDYEVIVKRVQPQSFMGRNCFGYVASFPHAVDEQFINDNFGGGVYDLTIRGPHPRTGATRAFLDGCRMKVAGNPKLSPIEATHGPMTSLGDVTKQQNIQVEKGWRQSGGNGNGKSEPDREMLQMITSQARKDREELSKMQQRFIETARAKQPDTDLQREALRMAQQSMDRAIDAEHKAGEKFERLIDRIGRQDHGVPPEMLASLTEQHRSELSQLTTMHTQQLTSERERYDREISTVRERLERELESTRKDLQGRIDREGEQARREIERTREDAQRRIDDKDKEWQKRHEDAVKEWERRLEAAQADAKRAVEQERERADRDRDSIRQQHQMQLEHMKTLHEGQITQITATHKAQVDQMSSQHDTALKLAEASSQSRLDTLNAELDRTRRDLDDTKKRVSDQGDMVSQAKKLKDVGEALGSAFGMRPLGEMPSVSSSAPVEVPAAAEEKGFLGTLMRLADSRLGENLFDFIKMAAANAAGMGAPVGMLPGGAMPGPVPQYPGGGQPMYPPQPGYPPPNYAPPGGYQTNRYRPVEDEEEEGQYEPEEEYEESEFEGQVEESTEGEEAEVETEDATAEEPVIRSQVDKDGTVRASMPYTGGRPIGVAEDGDAQVPQRRPRPKQRQPRPPTRPRPPAQPDLPPGVTREQVLEQIKSLVEGIEAAMNDGVPTDQLAASIARLAPPDQLLGFAQTPTSQLAMQLSEVVPDTLLTTYNGRQYLGALQQSMIRVLQGTKS